MNHFEAKVFHSSRNIYVADFMPMLGFPVCEDFCGTAVTARFNDVYKKRRCVQIEIYVLSTSGQLVEMVYLRFGIERMVEGVADRV